MGQYAVKVIGRIALAAIVISGGWQGILPWLDARGLTRLSRELANAPAPERRATARGWALRRWVALTIAPIAMTLTAAFALGGTQAAPSELAMRIALPIVLVAMNLMWHLVTTELASRRVERAQGGRQ